MNGFRVMGRVLVSGTKQTVIRWWWYQAARDLTGKQRAGAVTLRGAGSLLIAWFGGGTLWALGVLGYALVAGWFVSVGVLADVEVGTDLALPSPTEDPSLEYEEAGQEVEVKVGKLGKAPVIRFQDPNNPARTHLVWLDRKAGGESA